MRPRCSAGGQMPLTATVLHVVGVGVVAVFCLRAEGGPFTAGFFGGLEGLGEMFLRSLVKNFSSWEEVKTPLQTLQTPQRVKHPLKPPAKSASEPPSHGLEGPDCAPPCHAGSKAPCP